MRDHRTPALTFERKHRLHGIGCSYVMPCNRTMAETEHFLMSDKHRQQSAFARRQAEREMAEALEFLNPVLQTIEYDRNNAQKRWWFLIGVTSGYNTDDISYFVNVPHEGQLQEDNYGERVEKALARRFNIAARIEGTGWRPSRTTACHILAQVREKKQKLRRPEDPSASP